MGTVIPFITSASSSLFANYGWRADPKSFPFTFSVSLSPSLIFSPTSSIWFFFYHSFISVFLVYGHVFRRDCRRSVVVDDDELRVSRENANTKVSVPQRLVDTIVGRKAKRTLYSSTTFSIVYKQRSTWGKMRRDLPNFSIFLTYSFHFLTIIYKY